jgi:hypothetical protein
MSQICEEYLRLFSVFQQLLARYEQSLEELSNAASSTEGAAVRRCWVRCETDRLAADRTLIALDMHIAEHRCIDGTFTAHVSTVQT